MQGTELSLGQAVVADGNKYEVVGILIGIYNRRYSLTSPDGPEVMLDNYNGVWRLWKKSASNRGRKDVLNIIHWSARDLRSHLGQYDSEFRGARITAIGVELVDCKVVGKVDGVKVGEKIFYMEGILSSAEWPLLSGEVYEGEGGDDVEIFEGKIVNIEIE